VKDRAVLDALPEAITVQDAAGTLVYANRAAAEMVGYESPEAMLAAGGAHAMAGWTSTHEDGRPLVAEDLPGRRALAGLEPSPLVVRAIHNETGRLRWTRIQSVPLGDYAVNLVEDITEVKLGELRQRVLAQAGELLSGTPEVERTLQQVAQLSVPEIAEWCAFDVPDGRGGARLVALAHADPAKIAMAEELRRRFPSDPAATTGVPAVLRGGPAELIAEIPDALLEEAIDDPEQLEAIRALGMRSVMIVPMRAGEMTLGALSFVTSESGRRFTEDDFAFAQDLALRAGIAVQNARLYAEQARVATTLQASLLPEELPQVGGWGGAASYQAGEQGSDVGGDFYDIVSVGDGRHLVFLGDVTGKGIAAAALTSLVRHSVRTAARFDPRPAAILRLLNEILVEQPRLAPVTLVCGLIDGSTLTVAAAGHPPPLLRRAGTVREIGPTGILLGAAPDQTFREETTDLQPGDTVLLYTDGVTDTPGTEERFGPERLAAILGDAPEPPAQVLDRIEAALREFQAGTAVDDRAMLVLRFAGEPPQSAGLKAA
jgi:PAS domain S-box-containing protein